MIYEYQILCNSQDMSVYHSQEKYIHLIWALSFVIHSFILYVYLFILFLGPIQSSIKSRPHLFLFVSLSQVPHCSIILLNVILY